MKMKIGMCGSIESNDCLIVIKNNKENGNQIIINSIVGDFFYEQIHEVIAITLKEKNLNNVLVECTDKGALDYTIKARLLCAIERYLGE